MRHISSTYSLSPHSLSLNKIIVLLSLQSTVLLDGDFTPLPSILHYVTKNRCKIILTQMGGAYTFWTSKICTNNFYFSQNL